MEMNKARNMLEHEKEIFSRPPRTWMQPRQKEEEGEEERETAGSKKKPVPEAADQLKQGSKKRKHAPKKTSDKQESVRKRSFKKLVWDRVFFQPEEKRLRLEREYSSRQAKRAKRPKRIYVMAQDKQEKRKSKG